MGFLGVACVECQEEFFDLLYPDKEEMLKEFEQELEALKISSYLCRGHLWKMID